MAAKNYDEIRQLIINTLEGRPAGTMIYPEGHQEIDLSILDFANAISSVISTGIAGEAQASTQPIHPSGSNVAYIFQVAPDSTKTFTNFRDSGGNAISVTTNSSQAAVGFLLWNGSYWSAMTVYVAVTSPAFETISSDIIQLLDGTTPVYPRTKAEAVFLDGDTAKTVDVELSRLGQILSVIDTVPTPGSTNLVESGGVYDSIVKDEIDLIESKWISGSSWANYSYAERSNVDGINKVYFKPSALMYYAFLKEYDTSRAPQFATGYSSVVPASADELHEISVPADAKWITINCGTNLYVLKGGVPLQDLAHFRGGEYTKDKALSNFVNNSNNEIPTNGAVRGILGAKHIFTKENAFVLKAFYIDATTNKWVAGRESFFYKVFKNELLTIKSNGTLGAVYAFLNSVDNIVAGNTPDYVQGYDNVIVLSAGTDVDVEINNDCYIYILGQERYPTSLAISRTVEGAIYQYSEDTKPEATYNYYGAPISLAERKYKQSVWKTFVTDFRQSFVIYNDLIIFFLNGGAQGKVFRISTNEEICTFTLPISDGTRSHCNTACVGNKFASGNQDIPLIYLSMWDGNGGCLVLDIRLDGTCNLVQTIKYSGMSQSVFGGNLGDWIVDTDKNKIYSCKYYLNTGDPDIDAIRVEGNKTMFCEFELPELSDGIVKTLTENDIISHFETIPMVVNQDKFYKNGKMYISAGSSHSGISRDTLKIYVVDLVAQLIVSVVELGEMDIITEPEGMDCYDGSLKISDFQNNSIIYGLDFNP